MYILLMIVANQSAQSIYIHLRWAICYSVFCSLHVTWSKRLLIASFLFNIARAS